jgi:hypothetical protein
MVSFLRHNVVHNRRGFASSGAVGALLVTLLNEAATRQIETKTKSTGTTNNASTRSIPSVLIGGILDEQVTAN